MTRSPLDQIRRTSYVRLVTFRKNGERKGTPVWVACSNGRIYVWTNRDTWKVRRLRNDPRCELTPCDLSGNRTWGPTVDGRLLRILERHEAGRARRAFRRKYRLGYWLLEALGRLRPGSDHVWLEIEPRFAGPATDG